MKEIDQTLLKELEESVLSLRKPAGPNTYYTSSEGHCIEIILEILKKLSENP